MTHAIAKALEKTLRLHNLDCGAVADSDGQRIEVVGVKSEPYCVTMLQQEFGDAVAVRRLTDYLTGKAQPQVVTVGDCFCASGQLDDGSVVSICGRSVLPAIDRYRFVKQLWHQLISEISAS